MENLPHWLERKLVVPERVEEFFAILRERGKKLATLNGSFDLLHAGHLFIIHQAAQQGDALLVALNSDESIRRYKNPDRPLIPLRYRLEMMAALEFVTYVTWFEEDDPRSLLLKVRPDVHVNGAEYGNDCIEAEVVQRIGGRLHLVERVPSLSTTGIIEKIRQCV